MDILALIPQLLALGTQLISKILARRQAQRELDHAQKIRASLANSDANTKVYDQIIQEAMRQKNELKVGVNTDLAQFKTVLAQLEALAKE